MSRSSIFNLVEILLLRIEVSVAQPETTAADEGEDARL